MIQPLFPLSLSPTFKIESFSCLFALALAAVACSSEGSPEGKDAAIAGDGDEGGDDNGETADTDTPGDGDGDTGDGDGDGDGGGNQGSGGYRYPERAPGQPTLSNGQGIPAAPFVSYEAETMALGGSAKTKGPTRQRGVNSREASGRQLVRLAATGDSVTFENQYPSNSIVVRLAIPDVSDSHNNWKTISVYVDGILVKKLDVTTRYSWTYGDEAMHNQPGQEDPANGNAHHFFDETHALLGFNVAPGSTVTIQKDSDDTAAYYDIDLVEMEQVAAPSTTPANFLNLVSDCGANGTDNADDGAAFQNCLNRSSSENKSGVFIPPGNFRLLNNDAQARFSIPGGKVLAGAGMWHSTLSGFGARLQCDGGGCTLRDFAIFGDIVERIDTRPDRAIAGNGDNLRVEALWIEHFTVGVWPDANSTGLSVQNSRFRNLLADGVNLYGNARNSQVIANHARNTGDDAFAAWSDSNFSENSGNRMANNFVQVPWKANCFGIYGGQSTVLDSNVCADTVDYPGILFARQFNSHPFTGSNEVKNSTIIRGGGDAYSQTHGALKLHADRGDLSNISVSGLDIIDPFRSAIHFQGDWQNGSYGFGSIYLDDIKISNSSNVFLFNDHAKGAFDAANILATGSGGILDESGGALSIVAGSGNSGW